MLVKIHFKVIHSIEDFIFFEYEQSLFLKIVCRYFTLPVAHSWDVFVSFSGLLLTQWPFIQLSSSRFLCVWHGNEQHALVWLMVEHICVHATLSFLSPPLPPPVDIREIRELRLGKGSRDFERYPEEARKLEPYCFIVLYGLEFRLRTLSLAGWCKL